MKSSIFRKIQFLFIIFIIGSFAGFIWENFYTILKGNYQLRQGLLYEPLIPVYGIGFLMFYAITSKIKLTNNWWLDILKVFVISFFVGSVTEYIFSFLQELFFGTVSWDYSFMKFNINGRICLLYSIFWGFSGSLFYLTIQPLIDKIEKNMNKSINIILSSFLIFVFMVDATISWVACSRRSERYNNIDADSKVDLFLDKYYPDKVIDRVYNNAKIK